MRFMYARFNLIHECKTIRVTHVNFLNSYRIIYDIHNKKKENNEVAIEFSISSHPCIGKKSHLRYDEKNKIKKEEKKMIVHKGRLSLDVDRLRDF